MAKVIEVYNKALSQAKAYGINSHEIRTLLAHEQGYEEPIDILYHQDDEVKDEFLFDAEFEELKSGKPVEYIIKEARFLQRRIYVDERLLIPRMETEELVAKITQKVGNYYDPRNYLMVADIGTGSGAIALSLATYFKNWVITASDVSDGALEVAKANFDSYRVNVETLKGPSLQPYIEAQMKLDIIVSNPPYILNKDEVQQSVKDYEPHEALYLDKEHSVYEEIFRDVNLVKKGSIWLCFEIGYDLKDYLESLMAKYLKDYEYEFEEDIDGRLRFLFVYME